MSWGRLDAQGAWVVGGGSGQQEMDCSGQAGEGSGHCRAMPSLSGRPRHVGRHLAPPRECRQNTEFRSDSFWIFCIFVIGFIYEIYL